MSDCKSPKPFGIAEAAIFLGFSKSYLYKLIHLGKVPYYKPQGGRVFFKQVDLEQFIFRGRKAADYELQEEAEQLLIGQKG
jgi:excisionase family DNA binding protein